MSKLPILEQRNSHNMQNAICLQEKQLRDMIITFKNNKNIRETLRIMFRKRWDSAIPLGKKPPQSGSSLEAVEPHP